MKTLKTILSTISTLAFSFLILSISVFRVSARTPLPITNSSGQNLVLPTVTPLPSPKIDYYLPYPGILPDHPLYSFKMIRDRIWLWLTTDPLKRAEVMVLFADKRLGAGKVLVEGNKVALGLTTLEKAEKYLERSVGELEKAKKEGKNVQSLIDRFNQAVLKHREILNQEVSRLSGDDKAFGERLLAYPKQLLEKLIQISQ